MKKVLFVIDLLLITFGAYAVGRGIPVGSSLLIVCGCWLCCFGVMQKGGLK